ncbi:MAG TPA: hypothetical protein VKU77_16310 [Streptosporangiaceae bacterium]|nr:hypothetical protein [Streptosporangiaceae bacterium]
MRGVVEFNDHDHGRAVGHGDPEHRLFRRQHRVVVVLGFVTERQRNAVESGTEGHELGRRAAQQ